MSKQTIPSTDEAWEERRLGADEAFVKVVDSATEEEIDKAACMQLVSIRMQTTMLDDLRAIGASNGGLGYQTLIKQILQRFIDGEKKKLWNDIVAERLQELKASKEPKAPTAEAGQKPKARPRKAA